jgi:simple sugar transport system ATP-binding protein
MTGLTKRFGANLANASIDLSIDAGEIRGLLGENGAGKSTLMNILYGMLQPDAGRIEIGGRPVTLHSPRDAIRHGVGMVHQHFMLVPDMTVAENVMLGLRNPREPVLDRDAAANRIVALSERYRLGLAPDDVVEELSLGMRQRLEILKLLYRDVRVLILDEPTAVLTPAEWVSLSGVLRELADAGRSIVLITHKLGELYGSADNCTVLRDGALVDTVALADADEPTLARMMVGRDITLRIDRPALEPGERVLEAEGLTLIDDAGRARIKDVSLAVRRREILGIAGVEGNGQEELAQILCGVRAATSGQVRLDGEPADDLSPRARVRAGMAAITADRHHSGVASDATVLENIIFKDFHDQPLSRRGWLRARVAREHTDELLGAYDVRGAEPGTPLRFLSGGNQQKVVLARELHRSPRFLLAAQPTRGLDVGAMAFVYERLLQERARGCAILLISTELEEILTLSDRIAVIAGGELVATFDSADADLQSIGLLMAGHRESGAVAEEAQR